MALEETTTCVAIDILDVTLDDCLDLVLLSRIELGFINGDLKDVSVPIERELIHWVDLV